MRNFALTVVCALALSSLARAQITPIGTFTGADSEAFETQTAQVFSPCVLGRVFNNKGDLCTPGNTNAHITTGWGFYCSIFPHGPTHLFGSAGGLAEYTFDIPAQRFGGWFGTNSSASDGTAKLYDASSNLLSTQIVTAPNNCGWTWNGWDAGSGPKIKRVEIIGNEPAGNGGFVMMDDMQLDTAGSSAFTEYCFGDGSNPSLIACPCGNTGGAGRGCENSASTGGAQLGAVGGTSPDTVVLTSSGELPTAPSIFLQGDATLPSGTVFGDGIRCAAGILKRLYLKSASGGVVSAPGTGDPSITTQSANLGDPIAPGSTRYYQTYYRDPSLTFCPNPPGNTWNVSGGIAIVW